MQIIMQTVYKTYIPIRKDIHVLYPAATLTVLNVSP